MSKGISIQTGPFLPEIASATAFLKIFIIFFLEFIVTENFVIWFTIFFISISCGPYCLIFPTLN